MKNGKKLVVLLVVMMLLIGCAVGGTLAWLIANSNKVENTFTVGNITLTMVEDVDENPYRIVPGTEQVKKPYVQVAANSESCWVFVEITENNNQVDPDTKYVQWEVDTTVWTPVPDIPGVYYKLHDENTEDTTYDILKNDKVTYSSELTQEDLAKLGTDVPSLTFQAYAIQSEALKDDDGNAISNAADAWAMIPTNGPEPVNAN